MFSDTGSNATLNCNHGMYNATTAQCDCDPGWSTDANQDALGGTPTFCNVEGSTVAPGTGGSASTSVMSTTTIIIICVCVGVAVLIVVIVIACLCCRRRRRARRQKEKQAQEQNHTETILRMLGQPGPAASHRPSAQETADVVTQVLQSTGLLPAAPSSTMPQPYYVSTQPVYDDGALMAPKRQWAAYPYEDAVATYVDAPALPSRSRRAPRIPALNPAALQTPGQWGTADANADSALPYGNYGDDSHEPYEEDAMLYDLDYADDYGFLPEEPIEDGDDQAWWPSEYVYDVTGTFDNRHDAHNGDPFALVDDTGLVVMECLDKDPAPAYAADQSRRVSTGTFSPSSNRRATARIRARQTGETAHHWDEEPLAPHYPSRATTLPGDSTAPPSRQPTQTHLGEAEQDGTVTSVFAVSPDQWGQSQATTLSFASQGRATPSAMARSPKQHA